MLNFPVPVFSNKIAIVVTKVASIRASLHRAGGKVALSSRHDDACQHRIASFEAFHRIVRIFSVCVSVLTLRLHATETCSRLVRGLEHEEAAPHFFSLGAKLFARTRHCDGECGLWRIVTDFSHLTLTCTSLLFSRWFVPPMCLHAHHLVLEGPRESTQQHRCTRST